MDHTAHSDLQRFAQSGDEAAFARVVDALGGLVFSSALQRTGDREMAEEVAQNVFAILARKAKRVAKHPSLEGWMFTTTRLESATAMRKRHQHQRRIKALAAAADRTQPDTTMNDDPDSEAWTEALPQLQQSLDRLGDNEREILLARFYTGNSFRDIADRFGKSEAACKMRVKRSLEKLNGWLSRRGVKLSAATLATGLTGEWAHAALPASLSTSLSANALASAPGLGAGTILTNTLITMNTLKQGSLIAVAVLALGSVPVIVQHSRGNHLQRELDALQADTGESRIASLALSGLPATSGKDTPANRFLREPFIIGDPTDFVNRLARAQVRNDTLEITRALAAIARLSDKELESLIAEVSAAAASPQAKRYVGGLLSQLAGMRSEVGETVFDDALAGNKGMRSLEKSLTKFASESPAEALRWYQSRRDDGLIDGKGTKTTQAHTVVEALVAGFVQSDPPAALKILDDLEGSKRERVEAHMLGGLVLAGGRGRELADDYTAAQPDPKARGELVKYAAVIAASRGLDMDEAAQFVWDSDISERARASALASIPSNVEGLSVAETGDWMVTQLGPGEFGTIEGFVYHSLNKHPEETQQWIDTLPPSLALDRVTRKQGEMRQREDDYAGAIEHFDRIADEASRLDALDRALHRWERVEPEAARAAAAERGIEIR